MAGNFDNQIVYKVQQANDIVDVVSEHVSLHRKGREMVGLCPFHEDHKPSMGVNPIKQIFKCFACGAGGDVFKFIQMRENLTFPQALERLAERAGIEYKSTRKVVKTDENSADPNQIARINDWACRVFTANLNEKEKGAAARQYLEERKITPESYAKWRVGLSGTNDDLVKRAKAQKIPMELLVQAGLAMQSSGGYIDKFANRLMFPILDVGNRVIGFGGRTLDGLGAKYINSPTTVLFDKSNSLYGLNEARHSIVKSGTAIVVEGYTDVMMAHQFGITNVVAALGTSFTAGHGRMLRRYAKKVVLVFDSDIAGQEAANRALEVCLTQRLDIKLAAVPEGKDPCEYILTAGQDGFEKVVSQAKDVLEFKWSRLNDQMSRDDTLVGRKASIEEFLQTVAAGMAAGNLSSVEKGLLVNRLSRVMGLDAKEIHSELTRRMKRVTGSTASNVPNQKVVSLQVGNGLRANAEREALEVMLNDPRLAELAQEEGIEWHDFSEPYFKQAAKLLLEAVKEDEDTTVAKLLANVESEELARVITDLVQSGEAKGNYVSRLRGALEVMTRLTRQEKISPKIDDEREYLRNVVERSAKGNRHNLGMM